MAACAATPSEWAGALGHLHPHLSVAGTAPKLCWPRNPRVKEEMLPIPGDHGLPASLPMQPSAGDSLQRLSRGKLPSVPLGIPPRALF